LKVFFGKLIHPDVLQSESEYPIKKRVGGSGLVGLFFISGGGFGLSLRGGGSGEQIIR